MTNLRRILFVGDPGEPRAQAASDLASRMSATPPFLPPDAGWRVLASAVRLISPHVSASATVLVGDPAVELLDAAAGSQADIIAIGAPGDVSAGLNSVAAAVLKDAGCPILLVPGEGVACA